MSKSERTAMLAAKERGDLDLAVFALLVRDDGEPALEAPLQDLAGARRSQTFSLKSKKQIIVLQ